MNVMQSFVIMSIAMWIRTRLPYFLSFKNCYSDGGSGCRTSSFITMKPTNLNTPNFPHEKYFHTFLLFHFSHPEFHLCRWTRNNKSEEENKSTPRQHYSFNFLNGKTNKQCIAICNLHFSSLHLTCFSFSSICRFTRQQMWKWRVKWSRLLQVKNI